MCLCDITAWISMGEGLTTWIRIIHWMWVLSPFCGVAKIIFSKPTRGWQIHVLAYLCVAPSNHFQINKHEMFCSNLGDPVYTCVLCASHSNFRLITGIRTHMFSKQNIMLSTGRSLIGRAEVLIAWTSPLVPKFPSRGNFDDDGHVAFWHRVWVS